MNRGGEGITGGRETPPAFRDPPPFTVEAQGHRLTLHPGGKDRFAALTALIESARETLKIAFYIFAEDASGHAVRDALTAAARRGVAVKVLVDGFGADANRAFFADFIAAGGQFCCFIPHWGTRFLIRNHQKIVSVDGRLAMLGGFNIRDPYFAAPSAESWTDLAASVEGPAVAKVEQWFDGLWAWAVKPHAHFRAMLKMLRAWDGGDGPVRLLIGGPSRGLSSWARCVSDDLREGRRLDMMMAYFSPSPALISRMQRIARNGRTRLVLAGKSDNGATIGASRALYKGLLKARAKIWEFQPTKLHTKLIVLDDTVYLGSANFDMRSLYLNLEIMLAIEDADLAERMRAFIAGYLPHSEEITPSLHKQRATPLTRARWWLCWFLVSVVDYTLSRRLNLGL